MKKKITLIATSVALVSLIAVGGTLAWFTDKSEKDNVITTGKVDVTLVDKTSNNKDFPAEGVSGNPGSKIDKFVSVINDADSNNAYIRIKVDMKWTDTNGTEVKVSEENQPKLSWLNNYNDESFDIQDGKTLDQNSTAYFYYNAKDSKGILAPDLTTGDLFTDVNMPTSLTNEVAGLKLHVNVLAEAMQSDNVDASAGIQNVWNDVNVIEVK